MKKNILMIMLTLVSLGLSTGAYAKCFSGDPAELQTSPGCHFGDSRFRLELLEKDHGLEYVCWDHRQGQEVSIDNCLK